MIKADYKVRRKLKYTPLHFLLNNLDELVLELQKKDVKNGQIFRSEFTQLKQLTDEITLRLA